MEYEGYICEKCGEKADQVILSEDKKWVCKDCL